MSRFATLYEDPDYDDDLTWDDEADWEDVVAEKQQSSDPWQQIEDPHLVDI